MNTQIFPFMFILTLTYVLMDNWLSLFLYVYLVQRSFKIKLLLQGSVFLLLVFILPKMNGSMAVDGKRFLESNASSILGTLA